MLPAGATSSKASAKMVFAGDKARELFTAQFGSTTVQPVRLLARNGGERSHISSIFADTVSSRETFVTELAAGVRTSAGAASVGLEVGEAELLAGASAADLQELCAARGVAASSVTNMGDAEAAATMRFRLLAKPVLDEFAESYKDLEITRESGQEKLDAQPLQSFFAMLDTQKKDAK